MLPLVTTTTFVLNLTKGFIVAPTKLWGHCRRDTADSQAWVAQQHQFLLHVQLQTN